MGIAMFHTHWKRGAVAALAACAVVPVIGGCATAGPGTARPDEPAVIVRDGSNGHTVSVVVGERLEVILGSDYWTVQGSSRPRVLRQDGQTFTCPGHPAAETFPAWDASRYARTSARLPPAPPSLRLPGRAAVRLSAAGRASSATPSPSWSARRAPECLLLDLADSGSQL